LAKDFGSLAKRPPEQARARTSVRNRVRDQDAAVQRAKRQAQGVCSSGGRELPSGSTRGRQEPTGKCFRDESKRDP
jgi:hypothetical protein